MKKQISIFGFTIYGINHIEYYNFTRKCWMLYSETILFNMVIDIDETPTRWI